MIYVWQRPRPHHITFPSAHQSPTILNVLLFFTQLQLIYVSRSSYLLFLLLRILSSVPPIVLLTIQTSPQMSLSQRIFHYHSLELSLLLITYIVFITFHIHHMKLSSFLSVTPNRMQIIQEEGLCLILNVSLYSLFHSLTIQNREDNNY